MAGGSSNTLRTVLRELGWSRTRLVAELVARERATGTRLHAREVAAAAGISERRAYELLRAVRAEGEQP
jgi:hypothetical protein